MSDIEIRGGGAVAVDTFTLRQTALRFDIARHELADIGMRLGSLQNMLLGVRGDAWDAASAASALGYRLHEVREEAQRIADALRSAAGVYEMVELNARYLAEASEGDTAAMRIIDARRDALMALSPDVMEAARALELERTIMWPSELVRQATLLGLDGGMDVGEEGAVIAGVAFGGTTLAAAALVGAVGLGRVPGDARLRGSAEPVEIFRVPPRAAPKGPLTLASAATRIPGGDDARVRVEKYTMSDGSHRFAVYVSGTRSAAIGGAEPWDDRSNGQLYTGSTSSSYEATVEALEAAGAEKGDVVHAFGFSQGAMITSHLALEGGYDVATLVSLGSPVEADVGEGTLSAGIRHTDDPIVALAGGGHGEPVGAPGSFVAETSYDPAGGMRDLTCPPHRLESYAQTAAAVEATGDPRVQALDRALGVLSTATSVEVEEFGARRLP